MKPGLADSEASSIWRVVILPGSVSPKNSTTLSSSSSFQSIGWKKFLLLFRESVAYNKVCSNNTYKLYPRSLIDLSILHDIYKQLIKNRQQNTVTWNSWWKVLEIANCLTATTRVSCWLSPPESVAFIKEFMFRWFKRLVCYFFLSKL